MQLKWTASACTIAVALALPAAGQVVEASDEDITTLDTVVVTGYQLQNRESIDAKRDSDLIADFLSADELGRQPDLNVADSLRRLPGVVTIFDEDEGRYVGLRGLDQRYTHISINGGLIASTDRSDRDINIESIPPTAVKRLEVYKSITPDLDGQSVGGVINLVTRSAFDADGLYAVVNGQLGWHESIGDLPDSQDNPSPRIDFTISNTFANDTIGLLLSGTYFDKKRDQGRPGTGYTTNDTGLVLNRIRAQDYSNRIERWNGLAKFEYKPNDDFYASILGSRFDYQYSEVRHTFEVRESGLINQTATGGEYTESGADARFDRFPLGQSIDTIQAKVDFKPTELGQFEFGAYYSRGEQGHPYPNATWRQPNTTDLGYVYDLTTDDPDEPSLPAITFNDASALQDLAAYEFLSYFDGYFANEEDVTEFSADYAWNTKGPDAGLGFKFGGRYRNLEKNRYDDSERYTLADPSTPLTLEAFVGAGTPYTQEYYTTLNQPLVDADAFDAFFAANQDLFVMTDADNERAFYDIQEDVTAFYGMLTWSQGKHDFRGGVRYESTEVATVAALNSSSARVAREFNYEHFLPSFVYTYNHSDALRFRAGYAEAIGRPNHPDLAGAETFDEPNLTIRRANTSLSPRESQSFDFGVDWFIAPGQFFSAAAFHKIIDNQISSTTFDEVIDGQTFSVTQPVNLDEVKVSGLELSYVDDAFEFLPAPFDGLGVISNLTLMEGEDGAFEDGSLISQPSYLFNLAGLYNYGPFEGKLTYNYVDDRPRNSRAVEYGYSQLDAQVRYRINDNFQVQFEGRNITNNPRVNYRPDLDYVETINDFGNSWWLGVSYRY